MMLMKKYKSPFVMPPIDFFGTFRTPEENAKRMADGRDISQAMLDGMMRGREKAMQNDNEDDKEAGE